MQLLKWVIRQGESLYVGYVVCFLLLEPCGTVTWTVEMRQWHIPIKCSEIQNQESIPIWRTVWVEIILISEIDLYSLELTNSKNCIPYRIAYNPIMGFMWVKTHRVRMSLTSFFVFRSGSSLVSETPMCIRCPALLKQYHHHLLPVPARDAVGMLKEAPGKKCESKPCFWTWWIKIYSYFTNAKKNEW